MFARMRAGPSLRCSFCGFTLRYHKTTNSVPAHYRGVIQKGTSMNRPYENLSKKYVDRMKNSVARVAGTIADEAGFVNLTNNLTTSISAEVKEGKLSAEMIKRQESKHNHGWTKDFNDLRASYNVLFRKYSELSSEEKSIHRIERKSHIRALIFRFLTTLAIGFAIMLVYWVAGCLSVQMPLLRMPV